MSNVELNNMTIFRSLEIKPPFQVLFLFLLLLFLRETIGGCYMLGIRDIVVKRKLASFINTSKNEHISIFNMCGLYQQFHFFFSTRQNSRIPGQCWTCPPPGSEHVLLGSKKTCKLKYIM